MAFANPPLMKRLMESLRNSVAGGDGVSLLGFLFFLMGDGMLVSSSSSSSSRPLPNHIDFWLAGWLAKVVEVLFR